MGTTNHKAASVTGAATERAEVDRPLGTDYAHSPTKTIDVGGTPFVYRRLGPDIGVPVVFLHHWGAALDEWDPRVIDGIAARRPVIAFDNRGVGGTAGSVPTSVEEMARDAIAFIRALRLEKVDLFGFSLGGFVAQAIVRAEPQLARRVILAGTGPAGGEGIRRVGAASVPRILRAILTFKDPKHHLFFTSTANGQAAARAYMQRLKERTTDRDKKASLRTLRRQLTAIKAWGKQTPWDLTSLTHPVLVANGDQDAMVPTTNSRDLAQRLPNARLKLYPDAGHGGVFQYHEDFVREAVAFLG